MRILIVVFSFVLISGCIQEMDTFRKAERLFVVDGTITDQKGPHIVRISFTKPFNTAPDYSEVSAAVVEVVDDEGNRVTLTHKGKDQYHTDTTFQGVIGRSYHVEIQLRDGKRYRSTPEELLPVPEIEDAWYTREMVEVLTDANVLILTPRIVYKVRFKDPSGIRNYYRWRYRGTYQVFAPEANNIGDRPLPRSCSYGDARANRDCWVTDFDNEVLKIGTDEFYNGKEIDNYAVFALEPSVNRKFMIGYHNVIFQQSLTKEAYSYLNAVQSQAGSKGTIFETSNYQISGNIRSVDNPDEVVLGYFTVSAVTEKSVFVNGADLPDTFDPKDCTPNEGGCIPITCIDCRKVSSLSSNKKPDFWPLP